jgi:hypothetical protein
MLVKPEETDMYAANISVNDIGIVKYMTLARDGEAHRIPIRARVSKWLIEPQNDGSP